MKAFNNEIMSTIIAGVLSVIAWSTNSIVNELSKGLVLEYEIEKNEDEKTYSVNIKNLSSREPALNIHFQISPQFKYYHNNDYVNSPNDVSVCDVVIGGVVDIGFSNKEDVYCGFMADVIAPSSRFSIEMIYIDSVYLDFVKFSYFVSSFDGGSLNSNLIEHDSIEAFILRNQFNIYVFITGFAILSIMIIFLLGLFRAIGFRGQGE